MSKISDKMKIKSLGDSAVVIQLGDQVNEAIHEKVMNFIQAVEKNPFEGFMEAVPTYTNVTIFYDPIQVYKAYGPKQTVFETVCALVRKYADNLATYTREDASLIEIPVLYGGEFGPDLEHVAKMNQITPEEVVRLHSGTDYLVYMIGFAPGFPFLGGMDERIEAPRKDAPRAAIPAGSVGIAGKQTGIYPFESPGGWQIIGRTPVELFLPEESPPTRIKPGDTLRFVPIDHKAYKEERQWGSR